ncbi:hypothetical protein FQZ97_921490 [compost metagenome]
MVDDADIHGAAIQQADGFGRRGLLQPDLDARIAFAEARQHAGQQAVGGAVGEAHGQRAGFAHGDRLRNVGDFLQRLDGAPGRAQQRLA